MSENTEKKFESLSQGLGIAGLVVGILTLLVSFIPCFGVFALGFGVVAVLLSGIALALALKHDHSKGIIIGGLITALLGCAIAYSQVYAVSSLAEGATVEIEKAAKEMEKELKKELEKTSKEIEGTQKEEE